MPVSRTALFAIVMLVGGCTTLDARECRQACAPHPVRTFSQSFGGGACGCAQDVVAAPVAPVPAPGASALCAAPTPVPAPATMAIHDGF